MPFFRIIILCVLALLARAPNDARAACARGIPVWGTGDDRESCELKAEKKRLEKEIEKARLKGEIDGLKDPPKPKEEPGLGETIINIGGGLIGGKNKPEDEPKVYERPKWNFRVELMSYVKAGASQADKPGMPKVFFINGAAPEYYFNRNFGVGLLYQQWEKGGSQAFDPIMAPQRDGSGDMALFFPEVETLSYRSIIPYLTFNAELGSPEWLIVARFGIGQTRVQVDYKSAASGQSDNVVYTDNSSMMFDVGVTWKAVGGNGVGVFIRGIDARNETADYLEYLNMGGIQVLLSGTVGFNTLGVL